RPADDPVRVPVDTVPLNAICPPFASAGLEIVVNDPPPGATSPTATMRWRANDVVPAPPVTRQIPVRVPPTDVSFPPNATHPRSLICGAANEVNVPLPLSSPVRASA